MILVHKNYSEGSDQYFDLKKLSKRQKNMKTTKLN